MQKLLKAMMGFVAISALPSSAFAWDGAKTGKITQIDITGGQNYGFRIYMDGTPMCGTTSTWAYMNRDWDNYDAAAALLTSAYLSGKTVTVYLTANGQYCNIGYVMFQ